MQPAHAPTYICATPRLARALQNALQVQQIAAQHTQWQAPKVYTLQQWLFEATTQALLSGEITADYFPANALNSFTEKLLWQTAIESCIAKHELAALFDVSNLAQSAIEAHQRMVDWQIADAQISDPFMASETRQFLRWRNTFYALCAQHQTIDSARLFKLQIEAISHANLRFSAHMQWLGFDRITPLEQYLIDVLSTKNVRVEMQQASTQNQALLQAACDDINAEYRAAVAWAKACLAQNPHANLAIISPVLANIRRPLADLLDDTFHPESLISNVEVSRIYDFSLGLALNEQPMMRTALNLLRLCASRKPIEQVSMSALLLDVYWGDLNEQDERSLLDARMRKQLTRTFSLQQLISINSQKNQIVEHLKHIQIMQQNWAKKQLPSAWAKAFSEYLQALNWAQTRALSSFEYQAKQKWAEALANFAALDSLIGALNTSDAVQKLQQLCSATMFQPEAGNNVRIQVLGMLESLAAPIDGVWVLGLNDQHWPPPVAPNPLLPAALQRVLQTPGANPDAQFAFAQKIHTRLCNSADEVVFSWSHKEGERELRVSPLLADIPLATKVKTIETLAEMLAKPATMQLLDDSLAPPLQPNEPLRGGSKLFEAQAICPAWTFYQYRLGAKKLETPTEGLDSMARGNLVHAVLQHFWLTCKDLNALRALSNAAIDEMIASAIDKALQQIKDEMHLHLPPQIIKIEQKRLQQLLQTWLEVEKNRADFTVRDCEATHIIKIQGLEITCRIDRIDTLEGGDLVVIDYKMGVNLPALKTWADARIQEPQLPLYASLALQGERVVAACFAKINIEDCKFSGIAAEDALLPNVTTKSNPFDSFEALIAYWQTRLNAIAIEIKSGVAGVMFADENDLMFCDVKPLLRLPERALQFEQEKIE